MWPWRSWGAMTLAPRGCPSLHVEGAHETGEVCTPRRGRQESSGRGRVCQGTRKYQKKG